MTHIPLQPTCQQGMSLWNTNLASLCGVTLIPLQAMLTAYKLQQEKSRIPLASDHHLFTANTATAHMFVEGKISHPFAELLACLYSQCQQHISYSEKNLASLRRVTLIPLQPICLQRMSLWKTNLASLCRVTHIPLQPICQQHMRLWTKKSRIPLESDLHPFSANMPTAYEFVKEKILHPFAE